MFNKCRTFCFLLLCAVALAGCDSNPTNKLLNPAVTVNATAWTTPFLIYENGIASGGDISFLTSQEGQSADFNYGNNPAPGSIRCVKYSWDGSAVSHYNDNGTVSYVGSDWAGFGFAVKNSNVTNSPTTRDITPGAYTKVSFKVKGSLGSNVALQLKFQQTTGTTFTATWQSNLGDSTITANWQTYSFTIPGSQANNIQYYLIISLQNLGSAKSNGAIVYLDSIQLTK